MSRFPGRFSALALLTLMLISSLTAPRAEALTTMIGIDPNDWLVEMTVFESSSSYIHYQGTITKPSGTTYNITATYKTDGHKFHLIVQPYGNGYIVFDMERFSETQFRGFWKSTVRDNHYLTAADYHAFYILSTDSGDLPDFPSGDAFGEGP